MLGIKYFENGTLTDRPTPAPFPHPPPSHIQKMSWYCKYLMPHHVTRSNTPAREKVFVA